MKEYTRTSNLVTIKDDVISKYSINVNTRHTVISDDVHLWQIVHTALEWTPRHPHAAIPHLNGVNAQV